MIILVVMHLCSVVLLIRSQSLIILVTVSYDHCYVCFGLMFLALFLRTHAELSVLWNVTFLAYYVVIHFMIWHYLVFHG